MESDKGIWNKVISQIPSIKLLLVVYVRFGLWPDRLSCGIKERGFVYSPSFTVYCATKSRMAAIACYNKNTQTNIHTLSHTHTLQWWQPVFQLSLYKTKFIRTTSLKIDDIISNFWPYQVKTLGRERTHHYHYHLDLYP